MSKNYLQSVSFDGKPLIDRRFPVRPSKILGRAFDGEPLECVTMDPGLGLLYVSDLELIPLLRRGKASQLDF